MLEELVLVECGVSCRSHCVSSLNTHSVNERRLTKEKTEESGSAKTFKNYGETHIF